MKNLPTSIIKLLNSGIEASISKGCLNPLIKSIELSLTYSRNNKMQGGSTILSCDSFCPPHLEVQVAFFEALKACNEKISFYNLPISHYITSTPDPNLLELASHPSKLIEANEELVNQQLYFEKKVTKANSIVIFSEEIKILTSNFERLTTTIEDKSWHRCYINNFPFHELTHRDLSLTYKCTPFLACNDPFYQHLYAQGVKFNIWLLCLLLCQRVIGETGFCMSNYTASSIFHFFCLQTNRLFRFIDAPPNWLDTFNVEKSHYIRLLKSPTANSEITKKDITLVLDSIELSNQIITTINHIIQQRFQGIGSHTYSSGIEAVSDSHIELNTWIQHQRYLDRKITTLFTSSPDELIGQQLSYEHFPIDHSHLKRSVFSNQEDWIEETINHFSNLSDNSPLIIRFHPRIAADKRCLPESPYFQELWTVFSEKIEGLDNIRLVHPADKISSYWLGLESDLILNGWSTIGLEFATQNKIVTNAFYRCPLGGGAIYPTHLNSPLLKSKAQYFSRVDRLLECMKMDSSIDPCDIVSADEARKSFFVAFSCGLINMNDPWRFSAPMCCSPSC